MRVLLATFAVAALAWHVGVRPSHDRDWTEDQSRMPRVRIDGSVVHVDDVRDFRYSSESEWQPRWYSASYDVEELREAWFVLEYFSESRAVAHTFVTFGFSDGRYVSVSVEIRKERGESFSPLKGMLRRYELMYVFADERDVLALRTHQRGSEVYLHPVAASAEGLATYFLDIAQRAADLYDRPAFYNTLTSSCTTNLSGHLDHVTDHRSRWDWRVYLPGYSGELAWELGLIEGELSWDETKLRDLVTGGELPPVDEAFSARIRGRAARPAAPEE